MRHQCTCHVYGQIHKFGFKNLVDHARKGHAGRGGAIREVPIGAKGAPANHSQGGPKETKASNSRKQSNAKRATLKTRGGEGRRESMSDSV